jgi:hypothetical protein
MQGASVMNPGGKRSQPRSSWWSSSSTNQNWLGSVRKRLAGKSQVSTTPDAPFVIKQVKTSKL